MFEVKREEGVGVDSSCAGDVNKSSIGSDLAPSPGRSNQIII